MPDVPVNPLDEIPVQLVLPAGWVNYILKALGTQPFNEVMGIVSEIKRQGDIAFEKARKEMAAAETANLRGSAALPTTDNTRKSRRKK